LKAKLVHCAYVFAGEVNAVATANRGGLVAAEIIGKTEARSDPGRVVVLIGCVAAGSAEAGDV